MAFRLAPKRVRAIPCTFSGRRKHLPRIGASAFALLLAATSWLAAVEPEPDTPEGNAALLTSGGRSPYEWAYISLDYARRERVVQLNEFCKRLDGLARQAAEDNVVRSIFEIGRQYLGLSSKEAAPDELIQNLETMRRNFSRYYIEHYFSFYDILFIDAEGAVFYTIRGESDSHEKLFADEAQDTPLARCLRQSPSQRQYVDFHHYPPSGEGAGFFVEPMMKDGILIGWIALQCSTNKLDTIFAGTESIGHTGETFLVNNEGLMLTESNFEGESTVLRKHLSERNIKAKFQESRGRRVVTDYRGEIALTSFEVFSFREVQWLVVAKQDKAEVTTTHFSRQERYYTDAIIERLVQVSDSQSRNSERPKAGTFTRVDIDEFVRVQTGQIMHTYGVSTCTGLLAFYPERFGYLAHISVKDRVYGGVETNLVGQMIKKIKTFDIRPHEIGKVRFVLVAPHFDSLRSILNKLIEEGFLLSQVYILHHPGAQSGSITGGNSLDETRVEWTMREEGLPIFIQHGIDALNAGSLVEATIQTQSGVGAEDGHD